MLRDVLPAVRDVALVFRFLIDRSIQLDMAESEYESFYLLDEIEHLEVPINHLGGLTNVGRENNCQLLLSLQSVAQLRDTYNCDKANAIFSGMITVIGPYSCVKADSRRRIGTC